MASVFDITKNELKLWALLEYAKGNIVVYREIYMHIAKPRGKITPERYSSYSRSLVFRLREKIGQHNIVVISSLGCYLKTIDDIKE